MTLATPWTSGPWEVCGHLIFESGKKEMLIATVALYEQPAVANGRLIGAAPEMAGMIEAMLSGRRGARHEARALLARIRGWV
jgi:hypothetical protein